MNIYFGKVPQEDVISFGGEFFKHAGESYDFVLQVSSESFVIKDSCGRYVPFAHGDCVKLLHALNVIKEQCFTLAAAESIINSLDSNKHIAYTFEEEIN